MELLLVVAGGFLIYFLFIKKGESGTTLVTHRREIHKFVQNNGGMVNLYKGIVDYFVEQDFQLREVKKDYIYLHYGTMQGKVGLEILQHEVRKALITLGTETPQGKFFKHEIEIDSNDDPDSVIKRVLEPVE
ncbi:MAG: hypothetical protein WD604_06795 [Balneolaceae bacterium]